MAKYVSWTKAHDFVKEMIDSTNTSCQKSICNAWKHINIRLRESTDQSLVVNVLDLIKQFHWDYDNLFKNKDDAFSSEAISSIQIFVKKLENGEFDDEITLSFLKNDNN